MQPHAAVGSFGPTVMGGRVIEGWRLLGERLREFEGGSLNRNEFARRDSEFNSKDNVIDQRGRSVKVNDSKPLRIDSKTERHPATVQQETA